MLHDEILASCHKLWLCVAPRLSVILDNAERCKCEIALPAKKKKRNKSQHKDA